MQMQVFAARRAVSPRLRRSPAKKASEYVGNIKALKAAEAAEIRASHVWIDAGVAVLIVF